MSISNRPQPGPDQDMCSSRTPMPGIRTSPGTRAEVERGFGDVLKAARVRAGLTQQQFADEIGYHRTAVSRMESSPDPSLTPRVLRRIGEVLGVPMAQLLGEAEDPEDPVNRRQLLQAASATTFLAAAVPGRVGGADVAEIEHGIDTLRALDQRVGADDLGFFASRLVADAQRLLQGQYGSDTAVRLHGVLGEAAVLAGWLAQDAGRPDEATRHYSEVMAAATLAGDPLLAAHACANLAMLTAVGGQPSRAVQCAQAGHRAAAEGRGGPRLRALLFAREATGHAQLGDAGACTEAIRRSLRAFDSGHGHDPAWVSFVSDIELAGILGDAYSRLGQHRPALRELTQAAHMAGRPRNAASWRLVLAQGHATAGDPAQAAAIAGDALPAVLDLHSTRVRARVIHLAHDLAPYRGVAEVADFLDQARTAGLAA
jgi:transcriptional regulator with XRE-family HTH domain